MNAPEILSSGVSAFEHYMAVDDRPKYPMVFWLVLTLQGQADQGRLSTALNTAVSHHPLLSSHLVGDPRGRRAQLLWRHVKNATVYLDSGSQGAPFRFPNVQSSGATPFGKENHTNSLAIDLSREIGVRAFLRQGSEQCTVHLQFHHSATDGLGAVRFMEDVLRYYDGSGTKAVMPLRQPAPLKRRSFCGLNSWLIFTAIPLFLVRAYRFYLSNPEPLTFGSSEGLTGEAVLQCPARECGQLSAPELANLKAASRSAGGTINDALLAHVFSSVDSWQRAKQQITNEHRKRRVRILVPVNMRQVQDHFMSAANMIGMVFVDRRGSLLARPSQLLQSIVREMGAVKRHRLGFALNFATSLAGYIRGGVGAVASQCLTWRCAATVVLSNLGDPLAHCNLPRNKSGQIKTGGLTLSCLELLPPLRLYTSMAIGVVTYAGRLTMTAHYDHTILAKHDVRFLLNGVLASARAANAVAVSAPLEIQGAEQLASDF
ncbi:MAG: hypothetical protein NTY08_01710 [Proteobacteria bacterium]|nr:hypothetical protein [Pseudomonadota bacterium]